MSTRRRTPPLQYPIRAAARLTGVSVDTLRAWERRYEAVTPTRSRRGRLYSEADVARLQHLGALVRRGHAIGTIANLSDDELARLLEAPGKPPAAGEHQVGAADLSPFVAALDRYDRDVVESLLNRHATVLPPRDLVFGVVMPLLRELGTRWAAGRLRPAQEHLVSASIRSVLGGLLRTTARPHASPMIVFATLSGERHELGLLCAALLAASAGYGILYLGVDLPAAEIIHAASSAGARVVIVSLTTPGAVSRAEMRRLAGVSRGIELWLGGPGAQAATDAAGRDARHIRDLDDLLQRLATLRSPTA
jgi:MerR family transcriptional regulator, light-induced transcriptional regulator